ncbi:Uncharacterized protein GBIM_13523 [Gryllus bimaculatus]|nr:Uncharacterized protein GBIM_13523 [Gryllus bimaculatus]
MILFCTLNTHKVDMTKLLGGQIGLDDFIFVHRKGRPKEIELRKTEDALGLTITDNGAGYAFIKRIKEGSVIDNLKVIQVGDHIEKINDVNLVGRRHFEVAKMLKEIPRDNIGKRGSNVRKKDPNGIEKMQTIRFSPLGAPVIQEAPGEVMVRGIEKINILLDSFLGINDNELATRIWEQAEGKNNSMEFADAIDSSDLEEFGFTDDFIIELWGAVTDARSGRLK